MIFSGLLEAQYHAAFFSHKKAARDRKQHSFYLNSADMRKMN